MFFSCTICVEICANKMNEQGKVWEDQNYNKIDFTSGWCFGGRFLMGK